MKKIIAIISSLFLLSGANAQDCNDAARNAKGKWIRLVNDYYPNKTFPSNQYSQLYTRIDKIADMFQQAYPQPTAIEAEWYRSIRGDAIVKNGPVPYQFNSLYLDWYCNPNLHKLMLAGETGTWSFVYINSFGWFMSDQYDKAGLSIEGADAWLLPQKIGEWKGLPLYKPSGGGDRNKVVLITRDNQLPYKPVTRFQFLQAMKDTIEADKKTQLDFQRKRTVRSDAEEEAEKQRGLENAIKNAPQNRVEQRTADYLKHYKTAQQRKEETIQTYEEDYNGRLKPVNDELNNESNNDLQQPAIVNSGYSSVFKGFSTDEKGGRMIVLVNTAYFNMQLPRYVPQFIALYWSWGPAQKFKKQFEENFPVDKLKEMIDK